MRVSTIGLLIPFFVGPELYPILPQHPFVALLAAKLLAFPSPSLLLASVNQHGHKQMPRVHLVTIITAQLRHARSTQAFSCSSQQQFRSILCPYSAALIIHQHPNAFL
jgi:hypothetical protein